MSATGKYAELARTMLDEYYQGFQEPNPYLRVSSAHLHMNETTPHIHSDFVPFTAGNTRGLDTRMSLKKALAAQGFKGVHEVLPSGHSGCNPKRNSLPL